MSVWFTRKWDSVKTEFMFQFSMSAVNLLFLNYQHDPRRLFKIQKMASYKAPNVVQITEGSLRLTVSNCRREFKIPGRWCQNFGTVENSALKLTFLACVTVWVHVCHHHKSALPRGCGAFLSHPDFIFFCLYQTNFSGNLSLPMPLHMVAHPSFHLCSHLASLWLYFITKFFLPCAIF